MKRKRFMKLMRGFSTECYVALREAGAPVDSGMIFSGRKGYQLPEGSSWLEAGLNEMERLLTQALDLLHLAARGGGEGNV